MNIPSFEVTVTIDRDFYTAANVVRTTVRGRERHCHEFRLGCDDMLAESYLDHMLHAAHEQLKDHIKKHIGEKNEQKRLLADPEGTVKKLIAARKALK